MQNPTVEEQVANTRVEDEGERRGAPGVGGAIQHRGVVVPSQDAGVRHQGDGRLHDTAQDEALGQVLHHLAAGLDPETLEGVREVQPVDRTLCKHARETILPTLGHGAHLPGELALAVVVELPLGERLQVGLLHARDEILFEHGTQIADDHLRQLQRETRPPEQVGHLGVALDLRTQLDDRLLQVVAGAELEVRELALRGSHHAVAVEGDGSRHMELPVRVHHRALEPGGRDEATVLVDQLDGQVAQLDAELTAENPLEHLDVSVLASAGQIELLDDGHLLTFIEPPPSTQSIMFHGHFLFSFQACYHPKKLPLPRGPGRLPNLRRAFDFGLIPRPKALLKIYL